MDANLIRRIQQQKTCSYVKDVSNDIINKIASGTTATEIFETMVIWFYELLTNQVPVSALVQTHRVHPQYQSETFWIKVFTERLRNQGYPVGDNVSFLVIDNSSALLGDKLILPEEFNPTIHTLNYGYYIGSFGTQLDCLCLSAFPDVSSSAMPQQFINGERIDINQPIRFIKNYYECLHSIDKLVEIISSYEISISLCVSKEPESD